MQGTLEQRVAVITGGARGIGFAIAQTMVMEGAHVLLIDHGGALNGDAQDSVAVDAAVDRLNCLRAGSALGLARNISESSCAKDAVEYARQAFGSIDILVNNAAIWYPGAVDAVELSLQPAIDVNLIAAVQFAHEAAKLMRDQVNSGRVPGSMLHLVDGSACFGAPNQLANTVAKAGLLGLSRACAHDLSALGITSNALLPYAQTRMSQALPETSEREQEFRSNTLRLSPISLANFATWLCSSHAAGVSGQIFAVRGCELMLMQQTRPTSTLFIPHGGLDADGLSQLVISKLAHDFTPLDTEVGLFANQPIV